MKKILILCCWGTLSMTKNHITWSLDVIDSTSKILDLDERISDIADIKIQTIANINSSNANTDLREKTWITIAEQYDKFDGFVITTGTDTMAYFSSALSFSLSNIGKPVILTWAQIPLEAIASDGRNNFINALRVATMNICGVFLVFGTKIIRGARATKIGESELEAFESYHTKEFGNIWIWIRLHQDELSCTQAPLILKNWFTWNIISLNIFPWVENKHLISLLDTWVEWFILRWYGTWDVPDYIFDFLHQAQNRNIPVIQATQCKWSTILWIYTIWLKALACGVIEAYDMSLEAITTKLMRCLWQWISYQEIKTIMHTNLHGELDKKKAEFYKSWHKIN